jgi:hypothetical protein
MGEEQVSPERKQAQLKMREALEVARGRHKERGVEAMREAVHLDPTYLEPRQWLADHYRATGQARLAVAEYEEMLRVKPDNERVWEALKELDPATEQRLRRLHDVAPDPFVAQRAKVESAEFVDLAEQGQDYVEVAETEAEAAPFLGPREPLDAAVFAEEEAAEAYGEPLPWEHEQDREYRDKLDASEAFCRLLDGFAVLWDDDGAWGYLLADCEEPAAAGWDELSALMGRAAESLGAVAPRVLVNADSLRVPLALPLATGTVIVGAESRGIFSERGLLFWLGFACHNLLGAAVEYVWGAQRVVARQGPVTRLESCIGEAADEHIEGWEEGSTPEELASLARLCHAWEQRAVLSADRAGLLAAGEEAVARRAIAAAAAEPRVAAEITSSAFMAQFRHLKSAELAAIGPEQSPWTSPQYAAYRSQVIRWWATTDDYKSLAGA